ncbi:MAG: DUF1492 domain-containing protein [Lentihominibacter sp.]
MKDIEKEILSPSSAEWKAVVEAVKEKYAGTDKGKFLQMKYEQRMNMVHICMELYISQSSFYAWRQEIINEVEKRAAYEHLIEL